MQYNKQNETHNIGREFVNFPSDEKVFSDSLNTNGVRCSFYRSRNHT